jgi:hypothetical protein
VTELISQQNEVTNQQARLLMFDIRKVVNHVKTNLVIRRGADGVRPAEDPHRRELAGRRRDPRSAGGPAERAMDHDRFQTLSFA